MLSKEGWKVYNLTSRCVDTRSIKKGVDVAV